MIKYNQLFKQQIVNFYFEHHENLAFILKHFNLPKTTICRCDELEKVINDYVQYYNQARIQLKLKGLNPIQYRKQSFK